MPLELLLVYILPPLVLYVAVTTTIRTRVWYLPGAVLVIGGVAAAVGFGRLDGLGDFVGEFLGFCAAGFGVLLVIVSALLHVRARHATGGRRAEMIGVVVIVAVAAAVQIALWGLDDGKPHDGEPNGRAPVPPARAPMAPVTMPPAPPVPVEDRARALVAQAQQGKLAGDWRSAAESYARAGDQLTQGGHDLRELVAEVQVAHGDLLLEGATAGDLPASARDLDAASLAYDAGAMAADAVGRSDLVADAVLGHAWIAVERAHGSREAQALARAIARYAAQPTADRYRLGAAQLALAHAVPRERVAEVLAQAEANLVASVAEAKALHGGERLAIARAAQVARARALRGR